MSCGSTEKVETTPRWSEGNGSPAYVDVGAAVLAEDLARLGLGTTRDEHPVDAVVHLSLVLLGPSGCPREAGSVDRIGVRLAVGVAEPGLGGEVADRPGVRETHDVTGVGDRLRPVEVGRRVEVTDEEHGHPRGHDLFEGPQPLLAGTGVLPRGSQTSGI